MKNALENYITYEVVARYLMPDGVTSSVEVLGFFDPDDSLMPSGLRRHLYYDLRDTESGEMINPNSTFHIEPTEEICQVYWHQFKDKTHLSAYGKIR